MARLPVPGSDQGTWGSILNDFLNVEHNIDGTLKATGTLATKADAATVVKKGDLVISVKGDGVTDDTSAIQAAIDAGTYGDSIFFPRGQYVFSTLTLSRSQRLLGEGWHFLRDVPTTFGNSNYSSTTYIQGAVLRSTATSGNAITHVGNGGNNIMEGHIENIAIIGPGSGTSVGVAIGNSTYSVVNCQYRNVLVANFATGVALTNVDEGGFYNLKVQGCTTGVSLVTAVNSNGWYGLNMQRCDNGLIFQDATSLCNGFYSPICQNITSTGFTIRGEEHVLISPYFENAPTIASFPAAQLCNMISPTVQGTGIKTMTIASGSNNNQFHGLKTNAGAFTITNSGSNNLFHGILVGLTDSGANSWQFDTNNGILKPPKFGSTTTTGPTIQYGSAFGARFGASGAQEWQGTGTPEGAITAPVGSLYRRTDGGAGTTLYVKESGTGNTGWVGK